MMSAPPAMPEYSVSQPALLPMTSMENEYTVVICGIPKVMKESGSLNLQDTGIVGLDAAKEYLTKVGELSSATLDDSLVQTVE